MFCYLNCIREELFAVEAPLITNW